MKRGLRAPTRLVVASANPHKIAEVERIWRDLDLGGQIVTGLSWDEVEETGATLEENALLKASAVTESTGLVALADDTGLEVDALGGAPGVRSARYAGEDVSYEDNTRLLIKKMEGRSERSARFRTVAALMWPSGEHVTAEGVVEGRITREPRGEGGFGYDPVFEVEGRTLAEMTSAEKDRISHRQRALQALADVLTPDPAESREQTEIGQFEASYAEAFDEWSDSGHQEAWEVTAADGLKN